MEGMRQRVGLFVSLGLSVALVLSLSASSAADVPPDRTFTFYGSGYGHGLGLSQWGAYGLAQRGWTYRQILAHFYRGTTVGRPRAAPSWLRIGLTQGRSMIHLTAVGGPVDLRLRDVGLAGTIPAGKTWTVAPSPRGQYAIRDATGGLLSGRLFGGPSRNLTAVRRADGAIKVGETGHTYKRGTLEFNVYAPCGGCAYRLRVIAVLVPQSYLYGVAEVPSGWPAGALDAQAIAARTYAFEKVARLGQHRPGCNCGLYGTTLDQAYGGWDKESGYLGERWVGAVNRTAGLVVLYRGALIQAYYHASSGGFTENNENVWGGAPIPYLRGTCDPGDYTTANTVRTWVVSYKASVLSKRLAPYTGDVGTVTGFGSILRGISGRIRSVRVAGTAGSAVIRGGALRAALGLRDDRMWINSNRNVTGWIRAAYDRAMCAPGLPLGPRTQLRGGARQLFFSGAIYENAALRVAYWLHGPLFDAYLARGGAAGPLGLPVSGIFPMTLPRGCGTYACRMVRFERGAIYFKGAPAVGIHTLFGSVYAYYRAVGGVGGRLGFPVSDVRAGSGGGTWAAFERGRIICTKGGACSLR